MGDGSGASAQLLELAVRLARLHGFGTIVSLGRMPWGATALRNPDLELVEMRARGYAASGQSWSHRTVAFESGEASPFLGDGVPARSVLICSNLDAVRRDLTRFLETVPVVLIASKDATGLTEALDESGVTYAFAGRIGTGGSLAIVDRTVSPLEPAPPDFGVTAVMTAFNEEDVIGPSIEKLIADDIAVHLIDNWSTDATWEIAERYAGTGLVTTERFPQSPTSTYDWTGLLGRIEVVAAAAQTQWCIHHDADERRVGPWTDRSLRAAIWTVDRSGFNAIDHTVLEFAPIDDGFVPGSDFEAYFRHFEFGKRPDSLLQIKAWKNTGRRVALAASGGHEADFAGRLVFPYKFLLKHYPIRSQRHGERKILVERRARWNPDERAKGWHLHYDGVTPSHSFVRDPGELIAFIDSRTLSDYLLPIIAGVGLINDNTPRWALRGPRAWALYRWVHRVLEGPRGTAFRRSRLVRLAPIHWIARLARRMLMGSVL